MRSYSKMSHVNPGYDTKDVFTFQIAPQQPATLKDGPSFANFSLNFMDRLRALPGGPIGRAHRKRASTKGPPPRASTESASATRRAVNVTFAGADYYKTMGIKVLEGRPFSREDAVSSLGNVVVSQSAAETPGRAPIRSP